MRAEVEELITVLGAGGGYILGPFGRPASAAIQAGTPPENIVAMFDAASGLWPFWEQPSRRDTCCCSSTN